jgi:hypothetical protein
MELEICHPVEVEVSSALNQKNVSSQVLTKKKKLEGDGFSKRKAKKEQENLGGPGVTKKTHGSTVIC